MDESSTTSDRRVASIIHHRVGVGENELVAGWQQMLADLLKKMAPYLTAGRLVTFHTLLPDEKTFFETLHTTVDVPDHVTALFISPSVREQMMGGPSTDPDGRSTPIEGRFPDAGILLACRANDRHAIVNVLFAYPPHTPAIDIYDRGRLIAGYSYTSIAECRKEISAILERHLAPE
jgi:hypothetical protein